MKKIIPLVLFIASLAFASSCRKENQDVTITQVIPVEIKMNESYSSNVSRAGDADDVMQIVQQAAHSSSCALAEIPGSDQFNFSYTPALNYVGTDVVRISNVEGAHHGAGHQGNCGGGRHQDNTTVYIYKITIKGSTTRLSVK